MIDSVFADAMQAAAGELERTRTELRKLPCPFPFGPLTFNLKDLGSAKEAALLKRLPTGYAKADKGNDHIYVFSLPDAPPTVYKHLCKVFEGARGTDSEQVAAYCRVIKEHVCPGALYVGRSRRLRKRIAEHMDRKDGGTYAMHLGRWASDLDLEISISYITLKDRSDTLVQAVEDGLWVALKPALGRRGAR
ncbi:hypothetical protein QTH89_25855 [Variovorax sp. J22G21]|uniref:hypothetical protein n=1 Tax=Variovorax fucosicus TaxID=3053517 RepID=UPI002578C3D6|nr:MULTISPECIES: hypothetical protein [unclassified Variovorax]MDM0039786.1 hypothetical protein [Variovorax sp. J22R193]MDM0064665.1 hypothetical protein [Variovorax sp. J22G21]